MKTTTQPDTSERTNEARCRILDAALHEFAAYGLAGARTERIAQAAGVNKALLYYYFSGKEQLYVAALEHIADRIRDSALAVYSIEASPGEHLLRAALQHFDRIWTQPIFQRVMQHEMIRAKSGEPGHLDIFAERVFNPMLEVYRTRLQEGMVSGELIDVDWTQLLLASLGANVFYFLSAPMWQVGAGEDRLAPEALAARRKALLEFLGQAMFVDRRHGAELAERVYAAVPMPPQPPSAELLTWRNV